jgi:hypothetical protein
MRHDALKRGRHRARAWCVCVCVFAAAAAAALPFLLAVLLYCFTALLLLDCSQTGRQGAPRVVAAAASGFTALLLLYCCFTAALLLLYCSLKKRRLRRAWGWRRCCWWRRALAQVCIHTAQARQKLWPPPPSRRSLAMHCSLNTCH